MRDIHIEKGSEPLGISIEPGHGGGIFISNIDDNSLASNAGLFVGDQILEVGWLCLCLMRGEEGEREPLGISIEPGHGGGIFISNIDDNSLASNAGLFVGDQILEASYVCFI